MGPDPTIIGSAIQTLGGLLVWVLGVVVAMFTALVSAVGWFLIRELRKNEKARSITYRLPSQIEALETNLETGRDALRQELKGYMKDTMDEHEDKNDNHWAVMLRAVNRLEEQVGIPHGERTRLD